jgi:transketolase
MEIKTMRDVFLYSLYENMKHNDKIFFLTADFGSPILDKIREDHPNKFINVGIAEQNLINVATGLALEGFIVYVYAIAPFITMRCYEQIRVNIAILSTIRKMNINIIGVGAGVSYTMSGPTHHCLEDLSIMKTLPNIEIFSPSDYSLANSYVNRTINLNKPKYIRFDAKPMGLLSAKIDNFDYGFRVLQNGEKVAIISTGYMSQKVILFVKEYNVKIIDLYFINSYNKTLLENELKDIDILITIEEGFKNSGGLDSEINSNFKDKKIINLGFDKKYIFDIGDREFIHEKYNIGNQEIIEILKKVTE